MDVDFRGIGPLYIHELSKAGVIEENIFSFYMQGFSEGSDASFIDIGQVNEDHLRDPSELIWLDIKKHMFWMNGMTTAVRFGEDDSDAYLFTSRNQNMVSIIDSGTSMVFVPNSLWAYFFEKFKALVGPHVRFQRQGQYYATDCDFDKMPSIYLQIQGYWAEIHPRDYLIDGTKPNEKERY